MIFGEKPTSLTYTAEKQERNHEKKQTIEQTTVELTELQAELTAIHGDDLGLLKEAGLDNADFKALEDESQTVSEEVEQVNLDQRITTRFQELVKTNSATKSLSTIRAEFGEKMDEKSLAVLSNFEALVSPAIIPNETEQKTVEALFVSNFSGSFTQESFAGFVQDIYAQDDSVISEDTKATIEKRFNAPRLPIVTGDDLTQRALLKDESGKPVFDSAEKAVEVRPGLKAYAGKNGTVKLMVTGGSRINAIEVPPHELANSETVAQYANYASIRKLMHEELNETVNLFGGGQEDTQGTPSRLMLLDAKRFLDATLQYRSPGDLLTKEELDDLQMALKAMNPTSAQTEIEAKKSLEELGVIRDGKFQWERLERVGVILRQNDYFRAFELRSPGLAYEKLKLVLDSESGVKLPNHEPSKTNIKITPMSAFSQKQTFGLNQSRRGFSRWNRNMHPIGKTVRSKLASSYDDLKRFLP